MRYHYTTPVRCIYSSNPGASHATGLRTLTKAFSKLIRHSGS